MTHESAKRIWGEKTNARSHLLEIAAIIGVNLLWALCYPVLTIAVTDTPPILLALIRSLIAGATLVGLGAWLKRPLPKGKKLWLLIPAIGLTSTAMGFGGMFMAGGRISPGIATVLANTQPLLASLIAVTTLSERPSQIRLLGMGLGFLGILTTAIPDLLHNDDSAQITGVGYVMFGAVGVAAGNVLLKKISRSADGLMVVGFQFLCGSIFLFPVILVSGIPLSADWSLKSAVAISILAWPGTALVFVIWYWLLGRSELNRANAFTFLTPVFGLAMGWLFFEERMGPVQWTGIALTLCGVFLAGRGTRHEK
ncbi:DMT family transporter [bacterium]|nr:DMT family transporter [bacterium]